MKRWEWDDEDQVYRDEEGHKLRDAALTTLLTLLIGKVAGRLSAVEDGRRSGTITQSAAQTETQRELTLAHRMMAALAVGGLRQITTHEQARTEERIREQKSFLIRFYTQGPFLSDAQAVARISQYAGATYGTYQEARRASHAESGKDEARRVLDPSADHCEDCLILAERDWVPIGELVPIGESQCGANCRCDVEYRSAATEGEAAA
jgi:hypothetical protein